MDFVHDVHFTLKFQIVTEIIKLFLRPKIISLYINDIISKY